MKIQIAVIAGGIAIAGAVAYAQLGSQSAPTPVQSSTNSPTPASTSTPITTQPPNPIVNSNPIQTPLTRKPITANQRPQIPNSNGGEDGEHHGGEHRGGGDDGGFEGGGDD